MDIPNTVCLYYTQFLEQSLEPIETTTKANQVLKPEISCETLKCLISDSLKHCRYILCYDYVNDVMTFYVNNMGDQFIDNFVSMGYKLIFGNASLG